MSSRRLLPLGAACLLAAALGSWSPFGLAQGMPGGMGGGMGGGMPGGGGGPPGGGSSVRAPERQPTVDELMPPDPWLQWAEALRHDRAELQLSAAQQPLLDEFVRELDELQQLNARRIGRAIRRNPAAVSAQIDVARDLRREADEAADWVGALQDLGRRWDALQATLSPAQRSLLDGSYQAAWRAGPRERRPPAEASARR